MKKLSLSGLFLAAFLGCICSCSNPSNTEQQVSDKAGTKKMNYLEKGKQIAAISFVTLSQQLQKAMQTGGVPKAIEYCNLAAYPITDSLSNAHQAIIRRTSLKYRNPENKPTKLERSILARYSKIAASGQPLKPITQQVDQQQYFFAPIIVQEPCLKCHGKLSDDIAEAHHQLIETHYPMDKAIGYQAGDLRGVWSIQFLGK